MVVDDILSPDWFTLEFIVDTMGKDFEFLNN